MLLIIPLIAAIILVWAVDAIYFKDTAPKKQKEHKEEAGKDWAQQYIDKHIQGREKP